VNIMLPSLVSDESASTTSVISELITLEDAARRICRKKKTLSNWIYKGILRGDQGLYYVAGRPMIHWARFEASFIKR
jgi:hypothetical protein